MATQINHTIKKLYDYKKKRNSFLFFVIVPFGMIVVLFFILYQFFQINIELLSAIFLPILMIDLFFVSYFKNKFNYYHMHVQYLQMIVEEVGPKKVKGKLFTSSWLKDIENKGFTMFVDRNEFIIYYAFKNKMNEKLHLGDTLFVIVITKSEDLSYFSDELDEDIKRIYSIEPKGFKTKKQIMLNFKRVSNFDKEKIDEIQQIINYKSNWHYLIQINIGYHANENMVYFLCPIKKYPHKYYYAACKQIEELCGIKEGAK
ncbi:MAG: hypothetical protein V3569_05640 [Acholeplasmataceae bacterium]